MNDNQGPVLTLQDDRVSEINRWHNEVVNRCDQCEKELYSALVAAWHAGQLLREQKSWVRKCAGSGAWLDWLAKKFPASSRTAQRYMQLAKNVTDVSHLKNMSLRQAYMNLGLRVETKSREERIPMPALPSHIRNANRLLGALPLPNEYRCLPIDQRGRLMRDLRPIWQRLKCFFED